MIPHITNEIKNKIYEAAKTSEADFVITEIGGTVGDIESQTFIEALRQLRYDLGKEETFFIHVTLIPYLFGSNELKTKPTQNSVRELRNMGINPDALVCRAPISLGDHIKEKISLFCDLPTENIIESLDVDNIYKIPLNYHDQKIDEIILKQFNMPSKKANLKYWEDLIKTTESLSKEVEIALVGKYVELHDAYISVVESLKHAGYKYDTKVNINWVDSEQLEEPDTNLDEVFKNSKGILVPGGFGTRGIKGKIKAINYAREKDIPFLGICLGMQLATIEFARNVCGIKEADSREFDSTTEEPIIDLIAEQKSIINMGGTLRLGNFDCTIVPNTLAYKLYGTKDIKERHRHRYEFNNKYKSILEEKGMVFSGINEEANLVEIVELPSQKFFIACQFHPEFKSRPTRPHPLFDGFVKASIKK